MDTKPGWQAMGVSHQVSGLVIPDVPWLGLNEGVGLSLIIIHDAKSQQRNNYGFNFVCGLASEKTHTNTKDQGCTTCYSVWELSSQGSSQMNNRNYFISLSRTIINGD